MKPLVSIITPSYNQAKYLEHTIQSVLRQDYSPVEYIIVDGGSSDGSREIIEKYQSDLAWWVSEPDQGQADAINKGFRKATGEYIAWLNSDDLYLPGAVREAVEILESNPDKGVVYGDAVSADAEGRLLNELRFGDWGTADLLQFRIICQPAVFMRRSVVVEAGYLDPAYHFFLDHQLWIRLSRLTDFVHSDQIWAVSRYHQEAKNLKLAVQAGLEVKKILDWAAAEPDLVKIIDPVRAKVMSGADQITARYLLDGGKSAQAFRTYLKAAFKWPPSVADYWHRFLFSGLASLGFGFLGKWYYRIKNRVQPDLAGADTLTDWPGLQL